MRTLLIPVWVLFIGIALITLYYSPIGKSFLASPCYSDGAATDEAIADCTLTLGADNKSDSTRAAALVRRAELYRAEGQIADAYDDLYYAARLTDERQVRLQMVDVAIEGQGYSRARNTLSDLIISDTNDLEARYKRALVHARFLDKLDEAKVDLDFVLKAEPENAEALALSGLVSERLMLDALALERYEAALAIAPNNELATERAVVLREELADSREKASVFAGVGGREIPSIRLGLARGLRFLSLGDTERALDDMNQIVAIEPYHFEALFTRIKIYDLMGEYDGVIAAAAPFFATVESRAERYIRYAREKPDDAKLVVSRAYLMLGNAYQQTGQAEQAERAWGQGIQHWGRDAVFFWQLRLQAAGLFEFEPSGNGTPLLWSGLGTCAQSPSC